MGGMARRRFNGNKAVRRAATCAVLVTAFAFSARASLPVPPGTAAPTTPPQKHGAVRLVFVDSAMVNDTLIRVGDIAAVSGADPELAARVRALPAGEAAPAGFSRFVNSEDLVVFRLRPQFKGVEFTAANQKRIKVLSDHQERTVGEYEELIRSYAAERLAWGDGEWVLTVSNPQSSWKSGRGPADVEIAGIDNPFAKGNISLLVIMRQGSRATRVPVQCRIAVKAPVLVASRAIQRGEELTAENSVVQVTDITNFAFNPLRGLPAAGTVTAARSMSPGNILHGKMLRAIPLVARGDQVRIHFIGERVRVSVLGVARDSGGSGDRIWVENLQTGKLIRAAVSGRGSVVVHQEGERS
jgi:flagella basal body P-ring formation protein FlgA